MQTLRAMAPCLVAACSLNATTFDLCLVAVLCIIMLLTSLSCGCSLYNYVAVLWLFSKNVATVSVSWLFSLINVSALSLMS